MKKRGILLTNTGTPTAPTKKAVKKYLREFLSDIRIVQLPRFIWLPILHMLVLPFRSGKSAMLYQKIWQHEGSPMRTYMNNISHGLRQKLNLPVAVGMNYGSPSISDAIEHLSQQQVDEMIVLPLFPQFSHTSTSSSIDRVKAALKNPANTRIIEQYYAEPSYIQALAASVKAEWQQGRERHLLISFHGIPKRLVSAGDPYADHCEQTALLLANELQLTSDQWTLCYQSKFGYDKWLTPSTQALFTELPQRGIVDVDIICPGFSVDCLETLEEIMISGTEAFIEAGGKSLRYIPALNDSKEHIDCLTSVIHRYAQDDKAKLCSE